MRDLDDKRVGSSSAGPRPSLVSTALPKDFDLPTNIGARVSRLCSPLDPGAVLESRGSAAEVVTLWKATRAHQARDDHVAWIVLLGALRGVVASRPTGLALELNAHGMHLGRTEAEINLQLGSRLYHLGWKVLAEIESQGRDLLQASIDAFDRAESPGARLSQRARTGLAGMRGVARIVLARHESTPIERLQLGIDDLRKAQNLGDTSVAHFAFLIEAHLELHALIGAGNLDCAEAALTQVTALSHWSRELSLHQARAVARRAFEALDGGRSGDARDLFVRASELCSEALALSETVGASDALVRARRGQWRLQVGLLTAEHEPRAAWLHDAVDDLRGSPLVGMSLPRALTALAENSRDARDWRTTQILAHEAVVYLRDKALGDESLCQHLEGLALQADVWVALEAELPAEVLFGVREMLGASSGPNISLAAISHGLRAVALALPVEDLRALCIRAAGLARQQVDDAGLSRTARTFAASHGASLIWTVARVRDDPEHAVTAAGLFRDAIALVDEPASELLSSAGECFLTVARLLGRGPLVDRDEAIFLLEDAVACLVAALERPGADSGPNVSIVRSMLGDAFARLYVWTHDEANADAALKQLTMARDAKNARRVDDLLGNVHYRRGRVRGSSQDLRKALEFKEAAHVIGPAARENRSVCAAAEMALYDLERDAKHLRAAAVYASEATRIDPSWPWPLLQLAAIAARLRPVEFIDAPALDPTPADLSLAGREQDLLDLAAQKAASSVEFASNVLGGRQQAFALDDRHDLLSQTLVLKPTLRESAEREWRRAEAVGRFVDKYGDARMALPKPVSIVDRGGGNAVYVMRRSSGRSLAMLIAQYRAGTRPIPIDEARRAVRMLALYHAFEARGQLTLARWSGGARRRFAREYGDALLRLGVAADGAKPAQTAFKALLTNLPLLPKKDAHPDNWLIDDAQNVVMLDLEAVTQLPVVMEVAQLVDDSPLLDLSNAGFDQRMRIVDDYFRTLTAADVRLVLDIPVRLVYETFALHTAIRGLIQVRSAARRATSAAWLAAVEARRTHLRALCSWLTASDNHDVAEAAQLADRGLEASVRDHAERMVGE